MHFKMCHKKYNSIYKSNNEYGNLSRNSYHDTTIVTSLDRIVFVNITVILKRSSYLLFFTLPVTICWMLQVRAYKRILEHVYSCCLKHLVWWNDKSICFILFIRPGVSSFFHIPYALGDIQSQDQICRVSFEPHGVPDVQRKSGGFR